MLYICDNKKIHEVINVDVIYSKVKSVLNKNSNGYLSPADFNKYANMACLNLFNRYYGSEKGYQYDKPLSRKGYAMNQKLSEALEPFIEKDVVTPVVAGNAIVPSDKVHFINVANTYTESGNTKTVSVRRIEWQRRDNWVNSSIDTPTNEFPIYIESGDSIDVFPVSVTSVKLTYLRLPVEVKWAYTVSGGLPVYDAGNSVDFEFNEDEENNLIFEICSLASSSFKDNESLAYAEAYKKGGDV